MVRGAGRRVGPTGGQDAGRHRRRIEIVTKRPRLDKQAADPEAGDLQGLRDVDAGSPAPDRLDHVQEPQKV
jgi:hypothetical protein